MHPLPLLAVAASAHRSLLSLSPVDLIIIVVYFAFCLGIGFYLKKYASTGEDFFLAGRKMTAWIAGLSFISANLSSLETMGWSAMAYQYGMLGAHAYLIGAIPAIVFLAVVMMPFYYVCKTHSVPGYLHLRYGNDSRVFSGLSFTLMTVMVCGVNMFAMAKMLELLLGWDLNFSIWVSSATVAIYVALGGLISAMLNEVLQFFLIWLGLLLVPILGLINAGGWSGMMARITAEHPHTNYTSLWASMGSANNNPMGMHWAGMVFGLGVAVSFGYWCTDFLQVQRVLSAKSLRAAQNGTLIGAGFKMMVPLIVTVPGLLGIALLPAAGIHLLPESQATMTGGYSYNEVLPLMMARYLGPGLLGLGVTAMIAGFMSGMAGNVSAFATVWTYDVYRPLIRKRAPDQHYVSMGRWCSIVGVIIAIGTAYGAMFFSNILVYLQVLVLFFIVPLFGVVIMGMLWRQATKAGGFWGLVLGTACSVFLFFFVHWFPQTYTPYLVKDLKDLPVLAGELAHPADPVARRVAAELSPSTRALLGQYEEQVKNQPHTLAAEILATVKGADPLTEKTRIALTDGLNRLIDTPALPAALGAPLTRPLQGEALARYNRSLLTKEFAPALAPARHLEATELNPVNAEIIATSPRAQDMAVNMFSALWSLIVTVSTVLLVSLFTKQKTDEELHNLVIGLTPVPDEGPCPWYKKPLLWGGVIMAVLIVINIIFW